MLIKYSHSNHYNWWPDGLYGDEPRGVGSFDLFEKSKTGTLELWAFGIHSKENRGKGYGQQMLNEALEIAGNRDVRLYVYRCNDVAIHVYEKAGFEITGKYMGDQAWVMTRFAKAKKDVNERALCSA